MTLSPGASIAMMPDVLSSPPVSIVPVSLSLRVCWVVTVSSFLIVKLAPKLVGDKANKITADNGRKAIDEHANMLKILIKSAVLGYIQGCYKVRLQADIH